ncbi:site-specific integrase, partial [Bacillus sp. SIMBA_008]
MLLPRALDLYLRHVTIERGLSAHTIAAYRRDLDGYREWLEADGIGDTADITPAVIGRFITERSSAEP